MQAKTPPTHEQSFGHSPSLDSKAYQRIMERIEDLDLQGNLLELLTEGYTVLPSALSHETVERAKSAILRLAEERSGNPIDPFSATRADFRGMEYQPYLIFQDPVFEELLVEPRPLALMTYLLGESCLLSSMGSHFRGPGGYPLDFHADTVPAAAMSEVAMVANCNYALTPYSRETGALVIVPRSHLLKRQPLPQEDWTANGMTLAEIRQANLAPSELDSLEWQAPPGSITLKLQPGDAVIFHGNTWHGGWDRKLAGVRMNIAVFMCREHITTQERRRDDRYPDVLNRHENEPRFRRLLGEDLFNGWREDGPPDVGVKPIAMGYFD